jgi:hypothetical protein
MGRGRPGNPGGCGERRSRAWSGTGPARSVESCRHAGWRPNPGARPARLCCRSDTRTRREPIGASSSVQSSRSWLTIRRACTRMTCFAVSTKSRIHRSPGTGSASVPTHDGNFMDLWVNTMNVCLMPPRSCFTRARSTIWPSRDPECRTARQIVQLARGCV